jgi:hypothetical protein
MLAVMVTAAPEEGADEEPVKLPAMVTAGKALVTVEERSSDLSASLTGITPPRAKVKIKGSKTAQNSDLVAIFGAGGLSS